MRNVFRSIKRARVGMLLLCCAVASVAGANDATKTDFRLTPANTHYENALQLVESRSYDEALALLRRIQAYYPGFENISAVQTRIAALQEADGAGNVLSHYLSALDKRDTGDVDGALSSLDFILAEYRDSSLHDDALYLKAYVQIMDRYDFDAALQTLGRLEQTHPESSYQDSANYLVAIALEQLGQTENAKAELEALRSRHTAIKLPFGHSWPSGNVLSRYWYDRADRRIDIINQRTANASQMRSKQSADSGAWIIKVNVDGVDLDLALTPSPLTQETAWVDGSLQDRLPPAAGVFVGRVIGDPDSWVRAVIEENTITGIANAFGQSYTMQPGTLIGTLDYYQPRSARTRSAGTPDSVSTEVELTNDALRVPPQLGAARQATKYSDLRVVPVSIVVDAEFDRYHGGNGLVIALNQLNVADGIYRQFGIALAVDEVQVFNDNDSNGMLSGPATLESYLNSFRLYRLEHRTFFNDSVLTYLFTGKQRTDSTLGLAWIDTLCRTDGYDVGITTPSAIGELLLTHELGHSLGSQHDSDTSCNQDTTKIMWPHISASTQVEFSGCSQVSLSGARAKACLVDAVDVALLVEDGAQGITFIASNLDSEITVDASLIVETSTAGLVSYPAGCNAVSPTSAQCAISALQAGERRMLSFKVNESNVIGDSFITGQLTPVATKDFVTSNNVASYDIQEGASSTEHLLLAGGPIGGTSAENSGAITPPSAAGSGSVSKSGLLILSLLQLVSTFKQR